MWQLSSAENLARNMNSQWANNKLFEGSMQGKFNGRWHGKVDTAEQLQIIHMKKWDNTAKLVERELEYLLRPVTVSRALAFR